MAHLLEPEPAYCWGNAAQRFIKNQIISLTDVQL